MLRRTPRSGARREASDRAKDWMERSDRQCQWLRRREGSMTVKTVDNEGKDIAPKWEEAARCE